jgi:hypothetical protein
MIDAIKAALFPGVEAMSENVVYVGVFGSFNAEPPTAIHVCNFRVFKAVNSVYKGISTCESTGVTWNVLESMKRNAKIRCESAVVSI